MTSRDREGAPLTDVRGSLDCGAIPPLGLLWVLRKQSKQSGGKAPHSKKRKALHSKKKRNEGGFPSFIPC
jgi:hypothetical protein